MHNFNNKHSENLGSTCKQINNYSTMLTDLIRKVIDSELDNLAIH